MKIDGVCVGSLELVGGLHGGYLIKHVRFGMELFGFVMATFGLHVTM